MNILVLRQLPTGDNSPRIKLKPNNCPPGLLSLGQLLTRTTPHQDNCQPGKPLIRTNTSKVGNCPGGELSGKEIFLHSFWGFFFSPDTILGTILIVSSQTLNFEMYYFITWWTFFAECWCNGLLSCIPFTYKNICLGYKYTLNVAPRNHSEPQFKA